ncbi:MAG: hypothetical protein ACOCWX_01555 [Spirochaetota bacterium]
MRTTFLLTAMLLSSLPLAAQSDWTSFVSEERAEVDDAVRTLEAWLSSSEARARERYLAIQDLYVAARGERSPLDDYADALEEAGVGGRVVPDEVVGARERISAALAAEVPVPGTRTFIRAREWLTALADGDGFPTERFLSLVDDAGRQLDSLSAGESELFAGSLSANAAALPDGVSAVDRAGEALLVWSLRVLAADDRQRVRLIETLVEALSRLDDEVDRSLLAEFEELADERAELVALERAISIGPRAYALASALTFVDPERGDASLPSLQELVSALESVGAARLQNAVVVYDTDPHAAFLVDTVDSLLGTASRLQRYRFAESAGVPLAQLGRLRVALHRVRVGANTPVSVPELPTSANGRAAFEDFLEEGAEYVATAQPWADGERSRSGDAYRWAMLPILSHPYAQYMVSTVPELGATREMVDGFATSVYEEAARRSGVSPDVLAPIVVGDAVAPFARVYRTAAGGAADAFYEAFAAVAQGVEQLSRDFAVPYAAGLSVAGYWSHTHGLHVAVVDEADVPARMRARVDDWFALARVADTVEEEIALTARGLIAVRRVVRDELDPVLDAGRVPAAAVLDPRLPAAIALFDEAATFTRNPLGVRDALGAVFGVEPGSAHADALTDAVAQALDAVVRRLIEVEIPDRRLLERGASREGDR